MSTPATCKCGRPVLFSNETRCEDCYAFGQDRHPGKSERVKLYTYNVPSKKEPVNHFKKATQ